jgi:thymidylate synthase (FAD)
MSFGKSQSPKTNTEYIKNLIRQGHESVLEHASFTILADGISRSLSHQLVRHRVGFAFSQLSQQYHDESRATFTMPPGLSANLSVERKWTESVETALKAYREIESDLLESNFAHDLPEKERLRAIRSAARSVLPNSTTTTLVITGNVRAWRYLLRVRGNIEGDLEMRKFCGLCFRLLTKEAPEAFADLEIIVDTSSESSSPRKA